MSLWYDIKHKNYSPDGKGSWFCALIADSIEKLSNKFTSDLTSHGGGSLNRHSAYAIDCEDGTNLQETLNAEKALKVAETSQTSEAISDIKTELETKLDKSHIIDNLTTDDASKVLSAKQGKALNEIIGNLDGLSTDDKASVVAALNEAIANLGDISSLDVLSCKNLVDAVNNTYSRKVDKIWGMQLSENDYSTTEKNKVATIGTVADLTTDEKTTVVGALNELSAELDNISDLKADDSKLGSLEDLTTTEKETVVGAVNELQTGIGNISALNVLSYKNLVDAINNTYSRKVDKIFGMQLSENDYSTNEKNKVATIGAVADLTTTEKSTVVAAINELKSRIDNLQ